MILQDFFLFYFHQKNYPLHQEIYIFLLSKNIYIIPVNNKVRTKVANITLKSNIFTIINYFFLIYKKI